MKKGNGLFARIMTLILCVLMIASVVPVTYAASPEVNLIGGQRTVFVAGFGRMNYEGKAYTAFKTFNEAFGALGKEGGNIVISGNISMNGFADIEGRAPISIIGVGTKNTANSLKFAADNPVWDLKGDLALDFLTIEAPAGFVIKTNGHSVNFTNSFDTHYIIADYRTGVRSYLASLGIDAGGSAITINEGRFETISASGTEVNTDSLVVVNDGTINALYAGGYGDAAPVINGDVRVKFNGGTIESVLVAGSETGTVNGNVFVEVSGGSVASLVAGSTLPNAPINGNVVVSVKNAYIPNVGSPKNFSVTGKIIYISDEELGFAQDAAYDYSIKCPNGIVKPIFDGTAILGFGVYDKTGCPAEEIKINGVSATPTNGMFTIPEGKSEIEVLAGVGLALNEYAKYVSGYEDGTFLPQNNLSRAEAITMLARLVIDENAIKGKVKSTFADVPAGAWFESYIGLFENLGYLDTISKNAGTCIDPNAKITRAEFVEVARNIIRLMNPKDFGQKKFSDVSSSHPYAKSVGEIGYLGIIGGYEDGTFKPDNNITRAEVVTIINRMLSRKSTGAAGGTVFSDTVGHWAQDQILMAANPATVDGAEIWKIDGNVTLGNFKLLEGDVTLDEQIIHLYEVAQKGVDFDTISGIDCVSDWQIDNIVYSESDYSTIKGTKFYISPNGDDKNDGKSPETAWKSLSKTTDPSIKAGDGVLFERGSVFRGRFVATPGVTYSAYGEGEKPRFYGSLKNYAEPELWKETEYTNIWQCTDLFSQDVGVVIFNSDYRMGNYNEIAGMKYVNSTAREPSGLTSDLQFFHYFGRLYVYSKTNPGERFNSIEIGTNGSLVNISGNNIVIDNLHFRYHGGHVIGTGNRKNITCKNSIFAYTGGSILSGDTRYGNAFESYGGCDGWYAYNNWMYQIYDTGVTHQYTPTTGECIQKNVEYIGNVIEYCHWGIEYYNHDSTDGSKRLVENVQMYNNIVRMTAYGWGSRGRAGGATAFCSAGITENTSNFVARRNIIDRSQGRVMMIDSPGDKYLTLEQNILVQKNGGTLGGFHSGYHTADKQVAQKIADHTVEELPIVILNDDVAIVDNIKAPTR